METPLDVIIRCDADDRPVKLRLHLDAAWLSRPFADAVLTPALRALRARRPAAPSLPHLYHVRLAGAPLPPSSFASPTLSLPPPLPPPTCELSPLPPPPAPAPAPPADPYASFYARVRLRGERALRRAEELRWSHAALTAADLRVFASLAAAAPLPHAARAYLYANRFGSEGMAPLAAALQALPALRALYLQANEIGTAGVRHLCALPPPVELEHLALWQNEIDNDGFVLLAEAIKAGSLRVRTLVIHSNRATYRGKEALEVACAIKDVQVVT
ncbi:hypothetical protein AB1Y20_016998 [Prymnesium parvum]|uniref:Uncharacterized protein n=1 Tax=Prymnesium parvum TaxID=97485 RepID=A0AB34IBF5_PRYPA